MSCFINHFLINCTDTAKAQVDSHSNIWKLSEVVMIILPPKYRIRQLSFRIMVEITCWWAGTMSFSSEWLWRRAFWESRVRATARQKLPRAVCHTLSLTGNKEPWYYIDCSFDLLTGGYSMEQRKICLGKCFELWKYEIDICRTG